MHAAAGAYDGFLARNGRSFVGDGGSPGAVRYKYNDTNTTQTSDAAGCDCGADADAERWLEHVSRIAWLEYIAW